MSLLGDDRAQSVQVGAVLLFGILIVFLAIWQAQVIPTETNQAEIQHSDTVQSQLTDIRNSIVSTTTTGVKSERVNIGLRYSSRVLFVNPPPSDGTLRTVGTDETQVTIENATADGEGGAIDSVWDGSDRSYDSGFLQYTPSYNQYSTAPTTRYEHSVLYNEFTDAQLPITGQQLIDGDQITLVTVQGSYQRSAAGSEPVDMSVTSASSNRVSIRGDGEPIVLRLPTELNESVWEELFEDELASGHVESVTVDDQTLKLALNESKSYDLRMANVRFGSDREATKEPEYITAISGDGASVPKQSNLRLVAEVRDRFNNPVSGVPVTADPTQGSVAEPTRRSDSNGQVRFRYTASETAGEDTISLTATGAVTETMTVNVLEEGAAPQIDPLQFDQNEWNEAADENRVVHDGATVPWRHRADRVELGYPRDETWDVEPIGYWPLDERIGTRVYNLAPENPTADGRIRDVGDISTVRSQGIVVPQLTNRNRGAFDLSATDGFVDVDASAIDGGDSVTVSMWAQPDTDGTYTLFSTDNDIEITVDGSTPTFSVAGNSVGNGNIGSGGWTHIAGVYDPNGEIRLYINGNLVGSETADGSALGSLTGIQFGGVDTGDATVPGKISEIRLYDEPLSSSQVANLERVTSDGYLVTPWRTAETPIDLSTIELVDVDARFPNDDTAVSVTVEAEDTFGEVQSSDPIEITGDSEYPITGLSGPATDFRLQINLSTTDPQATPSFVTGRIDGEEATQTGSVTGQVLYDDPIDGEQPLADATVTLGDGIEETTTDEDGMYTFSDLFIGNYTIDAEKDGFDPNSVSAEILENDTTTADNLVLEPQLGTVTGRVVDRDDETEGIEGATVRSEIFERSAETNETGHYELNDVLAVRQDFTASATDFSDSRQIATVVQGETIDINFRLTSTVREISGTVTDNAAEEPLEGVSVTIEETGQERITDENGEYSFSNAPQEPLTISAEKDGYLAESQSTDTETDDETINFDLDPNIGEITGTVEDAEYPTFPLESDTTITATRESDDEEFTVTVPVDPDSDDEPYEYILELEPGEYTLAATADGYENNEFEEVVEVVATETASGPAFEMEALPGVIEGRVVDRDSGDGLGDATVTIEELDRTVNAEPSNLAGDFVFEEVPRGTYNVTAEAPEYQPRTEEVQLGPGQTVEQNFPLEGPPDAIFASDASFGPSQSELNVDIIIENGSGEEVTIELEIEVGPQGQIRQKDVSVIFDGVSYEYELTDDAINEIQTSDGIDLLDATKYEGQDPDGILEDVREFLDAQSDITVEGPGSNQIRIVLGNR
ncbi:carboxypeptidase regulatory-like domain-containing protein [Halorubraceae archaeon YAN]|nr:carboxypeptidase regulatory-like domain-containing protein [Halorubraceae archaeon YAN]